MKKTILMLLLVCSFLLCFVACGNTPEEKKPTESVYEQLTRLAELSYEKLQLSVTVGEGEKQLNSSYTITGDEILYRVERFAEIVPGEALPESRIAVLSGTATITNGEVTAINGDPAEFPSATELTGKNFRFAEDDFVDVKVSSGSFAATVKSPAKWLGTDKAITDLTVEVKYSDNGISTIRLGYNLSGTLVRVEYQFN